MNVYKNHQPLETIFKKPLHAINYVQEASSPLENDDAAAMEQHHRYITLAMLADTLSRASFLTVNDSKQTNFEIFRIDIDSNIGSPQVTSQTVIKVIKAAAASHPTLCSLTRVIITGWTSRKLELHQSLHPYWNLREELTS